MRNGCPSPDREGIAGNERMDLKEKQTTLLDPEFNLMSPFLTGLVHSSLPFLSLFCFCFCFHF
jgi:hypothetical protein